MRYGPLISIITPVYNNTVYLPLAIESIKKQKYKNWELIIVDDGSTDGTSELVDRIAESDERIKVIHQSNQWIYASMNNGIRRASGEYIYIVNSDDTITSDALQLFADTLIKYDYPDVIFGGMVCNYCDKKLNVHDSMKGRIWHRGHCYWSDTTNNPDIILDLMKSGFLYDQANLYKRELLIRYPFRNDFYAADTYNNYVIAGIINSFAVIDKELYIHHIFDDKNMNVANKKYYGYEHKMYNELFEQANTMLRKRGYLYGEYLEEVVKNRKTHFTQEIRKLIYDYSYKNINDRLDELLEIPYDEVLRVCFKDGKEEFDARILSELRSFFIMNDTNETRNHFLYGFLEALLRYEKEPEDWEIIEKGIYNEKNINHVGELFYNRLKRSCH